MRAAGLVALVVMGGLAGSARIEQEPVPGPDAHEPVPERQPAAAPPRRLFVSGHSLTARPLPDHLAAIAEAAGRPLDWNMQHFYGSTIEMRTRGRGGDAGYHEGLDRAGARADVLHEIASPHPAGRYDTLIITERDSLLESLMWDDTIGNALDYIRRFEAANPGSRTFLYTSWLGHSGADTPGRWIDYERSAAVAWHCSAAQLNRRLAAENNRHRVALIPAAEALAELVAEAMSPRGIDGLSGAAPRETIARLFTDDVHLTEAGTYFVALIAHDGMHGALPERAWAPDGVDPRVAGALQRFATRFMQRWRTGPPAPADCGAALARDYVPAYLGYARDFGWRESQGTWLARIKWARFSIVWARDLRSRTRRNPFAPGAIAAR